MKAILSRVGLLLALVSTFAWADSADVHCLKVGKAWDELSEKDQKKVEAGEVFMIQETPEGKEWPLVRIYFIVKSTPEEAMAVFGDYNRQTEYMTALREAKAIARPAARRTNVHYVAKAFISSSWYNTQNLVSYEPSIDQFRVDWSQLGKAEHATMIEGVVRTEPHGSATLVAYRLYTEADAGVWTGIVKGDGPGSAQKTMTQLRDRILDLRTNNQKVLKEEVEALKKLLAEK